MTTPSIVIPGRPLAAAAPAASEAPATALEAVVAPLQRKNINALAKFFGLQGKTEEHTQAAAAIVVAAPAAAAIAVVPPAAAETTRPAKKAFNPFAIRFAARTMRNARAAHEHGGTAAPPEAEEPSAAQPPAADGSSQSLAKKKLAPPQPTPAPGQSSKAGTSSGQPEPAFPEQPAQPPATASAGEEGNAREADKRVPPEDTSEQRAALREPAPVLGAPAAPSLVEGPGGTARGGARTSLSASFNSYFFPLCRQTEPPIAVATVAGMPLHSLPRLPPPFTGSVEGDNNLLMAKLEAAGEREMPLSEAMVHLRDALHDRRGIATEGARALGSDSRVLAACLRAHRHSPTAAVAALNVTAACQMRAHSPLAPISPLLALEILTYGYAELLPVRDVHGCAVILLKDTLEASRLAQRFGTTSLLRAVMWLAREAVLDSAETALCGLTLLEDFGTYGTLAHTGWLMQPALHDARSAMAACFPEHAPFKVAATIVYNMPRGGIAMHSGWGVCWMLTPRGTVEVKRGERELHQRAVLSRFVVDTTLPQALGGPLRYNFGEWIEAKANRLPSRVDAAEVIAHVRSSAYAGLPTSRDDVTFAAYPQPAPGSPPGFPAAAA